MTVHDSHDITQLTVSVISYHPVSMQLNSQTFVIKGCQIFEVINIMWCDRVQWYKVAYSWD